MGNSNCYDNRCCSNFRDFRLYTVSDSWCSYYCFSIIFIQIRRMEEVLEIE